MKNTFKTSHPSQNQIFGWRACHNALPTGEKILIADIGDDLRSMCTQAVESTSQALKICNMTSKILALSGLGNSIIIDFASSCKEWFEYAATSLGHEGFNLFIILIWNLWNRRDIMVHEYVLQNDLVDITATWEFRAAIKISTASSTIGSNVMHASPKMLWCNPLEGLIKINVDGAFQSKSGETVARIVACDHHMLVIGGLARKLDPPQTSKSA
ncbi:hypothetical protein F3Y22_tig00111810pilonHSYRG00042 [Hibiscus syriacus]|uniref:RNase H type-1 domain-containing protein n=1 Tax=Hibiscus syriacus TaxID=106335 RepID=A0A6A2XBZ9_HIBSY|nr:hypothetical protein F3Y22_tig00111810pilonHSYRG00042 [Hibiscus syriacus]